MEYLVTATVCDTDPDGWVGTCQIPTFVLDANIQGIRDATDAVTIARQILQAPGRTVHAFAMER